MRLLYREDWDEVRARMRAWWNGEDIGRPAVLVSVPRTEPMEAIPEVAVPEGDTPPNYTTRSIDYRVNHALRCCLHHDYLGEAVPSASPGDLAPDCLALYLGCTGREMPDTVWCEPVIDDPKDAHFRYDPENFYWQFSLEAIRRVKPLARGKFLVGFPDLIEGLDTLAAMRGSERLLSDLIDRPQWVHHALRSITDLYFRYYDMLYDLIRDEMGGSVYWIWAPGRMAKFQCDFSGMISPSMFREFMVPILTEMTERVSYNLYHWDGPGALRHLRSLISIPRLDVIAYAPGAGQPPTWHPCWWPMYHELLDAGKRVFLWAGTEEQLLAVRREFGEQCKRMLISSDAKTRQEAQAKITLMEF